MKNDSIRAEKSRAEKQRAYSWANSVYSVGSRNVAPVDLFAVARRRHIIRAGFRLMVQRGVLVPISGGFELLLRDLESRDLDIATEEPLGTLSPRQRFTFAHELAHTYFYEVSEGVPTVRKVEMIPPELEEVCDGAAGRILVPASLLKREINQELSGNRERIDAHFVRAMAVRFGVSHEVMINRFHVVESGNVFARCILLVRRKLGESQIGACYMGLTLLSVFPKPKAYDSVAKWLPELPGDILERDGSGKWDVTRRGHQLEIEKIPLGRSGDFLLQVDYPKHRAPTSK